MSIDWPRLPSLTSLRAFQAVADLGGLSAAARALNVTHAAVAQQVRALETHLGLALVLREGRGMALTAEGQQLALALDEGFAAIQTGVQAVQAGGADRPVRITLTPSFASQWLMPRLKDFWRLHPDIPLSLHPDARVVDLRREGMDLGIRYGNGDWPGVAAVRLTSARLIVAGTPELAARAAAGPAAMCAIPWVASDEDWPELTNWLQSNGIATGRLSVAVFPGEELAIAAAREGLGLVAESHALLEEDLRSGRLVKVLDGSDDLPAYFIVTPPGQSRKPTRAFLKWLAQAA